MTLDPADHAPPEPRAEVRPLAQTWHGVTLIDEFAWLKAANWQEVMRDPGRLDPAIRAYLLAENRYADQVLGDTARLQAALFAEMKGRIEDDDATVPTPDGPFAYYARYRQGGQHPLLCRQPRSHGDEQILIDGDALAAGKAYFQLGPTRHSPDHRLLAFASDETGSEFYRIRVRDLARGTDLADVVPDAAGSVVWAADASAFWYVRLDHNHRASRVFRHQLGTSSEFDALVYEERDPRYFVTLSVLQSRRYGEISIHDHETSESRLIDLWAADAAPLLVAARETGVRYDVEHHPGVFGTEGLILRTNADGAEDFKLAWAPLAARERPHWRELVPHQSGIYLAAFGLLQDWLWWIERQDGLPRVIVRHLQSGREHTVTFAEEAYSLAIETGFEFATDLLRLSYSSMRIPAEIWDYNLRSRTKTLRKRQEIPSGHDPSAYVTRRLMALAPDGETIPVSILHHRSVAADGTAACLLYGYGAYGLAIPAAFNANRLSLVNRGFVYAIAHVRGGTEKGWRWYREGKLEKKRNSFTDFIAVGEYLINQGWAAKGKMIAHGGSAGGMLVGAIANLRPDLVAGILADVPFVDVLNTMLDEALPLTPPEWLEWGNPVVDRTAFDCIHSYSPYENVHHQDYPAILVLAGLTDPRVLYWEPAKWVARLRARRTNHQLLAFRTNLKAGHGGAAGRYERLKDIALGYAFAITVSGVPWRVRFA